MVGAPRYSLDIDHHGDELQSAQPKAAADQNSRFFQADFGVMRSFVLCFSFI
jgi:hypothetical protein